MEVELSGIERDALGNQAHRRNAVALIVGCCEMSKYAYEGKAAYKRRCRNQQHFRIDGQHRSYRPHASEAFIEMQVPLALSPSSNPASSLPRQTLMPSAPSAAGLRTIS